jgi:ABC-2 type transport system ATP-binding protein
VNFLTKDTEASSILKIKNLTKKYGNLTAVNNISFDVKKGEIFGLLGPNGAGKTTSINIICGLVGHDSGEIIFNGNCGNEETDISNKYNNNNNSNNTSLLGKLGISSKFPQLNIANNNTATIKHNIGLCPQDIIIWDNLTCIEQLEFIGQMYGISSKKSRQKGLELLNELGLIEKEKKLASTLSGGMKRRLNIALALVHDPEILILDEPQAGLDPQSRILVREYIQKISKNITIILTTHDMDEADRLSDRIAIIDNGEILVIDTPENLKNNIGTGDILEISTFADKATVDLLLQNFSSSIKKYNYLDNKIKISSDQNYELMPRLLECFKANNISIDDIKIHKNTLEDVFITLTGRGLRE